MRALLALLLAACAASQPAPRFYFQNQVHARAAHVAWTTPKGVQVDPSGQAINPARVDRLVDEVEACLPARLSPATVQASQCWSDAPKVERARFRVIVIADWFLSSVAFAGSHHQMIPGVVATGCTEKGMPSGDCYRRVGIVDNSTIVTTPALYLFKQGVVTVATGCNDPWASPELAACMVPTTGPLDDGTGP